MKGAESRQKQLDDKLPIGEKRRWEEGESQDRKKKGQPN